MAIPVELTPQQVVESFLASMDDLDRSMDHVADDIVYENIGTFPLPTVRGRAATARFLGRLLRVCSGFAVEIHAIASEGPIVLTERTDSIVFGRTHARFWVCGRFEVRGGKIVHWRDYYDNGNIAVALARAALSAAVSKFSRA